MMFPHQKLDWTITRFEQQLDKRPDDSDVRYRYAIALLSKAKFHDGGEPCFNQAVTQARKVLNQDPGHIAALVIAGTSLLGLNRTEQATRYLHKALEMDAERADLRMGLSELAWKKGDKHQAIRELETACRLAPDSWEPHCLLGLLLRARAEDLGLPRRLLERSQFHIVKALQLNPSTAYRARLIHNLGVSCLETNRLDDALHMFQQLQEHPKYRIKARYYLGLVAYHLGKYKNAILHLRRHLDSVPENPRVYARIGMCYLHLGEVAKAREACNRALAVAPEDPQARWTLGCALMEENRVDEAVRVFKELLQDVPEHTPAFKELVRIRRDMGNTEWLEHALKSEVRVHDRLPLEVSSQPDGPIVHPRSATRERVAILIKALTSLASDPVPRILASMDLTTDEGLRFALWEAALDHMAHNRANRASQWLGDPSTHYGSEKGREIVTLAHLIPEPLLTQGLQITEEDLRRSAVARHGSTADILKHRSYIEYERNNARAWQALLLLATGVRNTRSGRNLLVRWSTEADEELAAAAQIALVIMGDVQLAEQLRGRSCEFNAEYILDRLVRQVSPSMKRSAPRPVSGDEDLHCSTCKRRTTEVTHMMAGNQSAICDRCMATIALERRKLKTEDPNVVCALSGVNCLESRGIYVFNDLAVSAECLDQGLGLIEREEVDRYLASCS